MEYSTGLNIDKQAGKSGNQSEVNIILSGMSNKRQIDNCLYTEMFNREVPELDKDELKIKWPKRYKKIQGGNPWSG